MKNVLSSTLLIALLLAGVDNRAFAVPQINLVFPRGLTIGQPVTLTIEGSELAENAQLVTSLPLQSPQLQPNPQANKVTLQFTVGENAVPGIYALRLATHSGVSNAVLVSVDHLNAQLWSEEITNLPIALLGDVNGGEVKRTHFNGQQGARIVVDVEARRLGANFKPVVRLLDGRGRQLAFAASQPWWGGDARLIATLPAAGKYTVELHDQLYRAAAPSAFKLKIGDLAVADRVHPAAVTMNQTAKLQFVGSTLPLATSFDFAANGLLPGNSAVTWPVALRTSGPRPTVLISEHAELIENGKPGEKQELSVAPVGVSGILSTPAEEDQYTIPVTPGQVLRVEVFAQRLGSPLDGVLNLRNEQGQQLAQADDSPGSADPLLPNFTVPAGVTKLVIAVSDLERRGGFDFNYRVEVRPTNQPDFSLSLATERIQIPAGGTQVLQVQATRMGYNGPIRLEFPGLPAEIQVSGSEIGEGANVGLIALTSSANSSAAGLASLVGRGGEMIRVAQVPEFPGSITAPYLRTEIAWGISPALPIQIAWSPLGDKLLQGQSLAGNVQITRLPNAPGNVRLKLVSTQAAIKKKIKQDNKDVEVDDLERLLHLEPEVQIAADKTEAAATIFVPGDLPKTNWDLSLAAELLSADGKTVAAIAYAPIRRFSVESSLVLELVGPNQAEGIAGTGTTGKFTGKVIRTAGYTRPVVVTLQGLPMGYAAPVEEVAADKSEFELELRFPVGNKPGELKGLKLVAVADKNSAAAAKSNTIDVSVNLKQGEKPLAEKPKELFEDDPAFLALLAEGKGMATIDTDKQSGQSAIHITPDQRYAASIPGYEFKIRENPGAGEYRYLRFAWKKKAGNAICFQLAHEGRFGPGGSTREGAKFRYHAGPGGEQYGGSVSVAPTLPQNYEIVTRDLFVDFGEFTLTGLGLSPVDGQAALFDGIYLGKTPEDFELIGK